ncbi:chromobox protein homolog 8-like [Haliotis rufescens]|uniref:chromobox protein homolog 8-like n=1 Tax=Haliotis rufescens TaxID=6454 RepID=UPI001EAFA069|nr:chromobox protein homolog 8-like [Haliotis rufescens]
MELPVLGDRIFQADNIQKKRYRKGRVEYLVKWKGYTLKHSTWEPKDNILDPLLIAEFEDKRQHWYGRKRQKLQQKRRQSQMSAGSPQTSDTVADDSDLDEQDGTQSLYGDNSTHQNPEQQDSMNNNFWRPFFGGNDDCESPMSEDSSTEKESDKDSDYDPENDLESSKHVSRSGCTDRDLYSVEEGEEVRGRSSPCSDRAFWGMPFDKKVNTDLNLLPLTRGAACKEGELTACEALIRLGECRDHLNNVIEPMKSEYPAKQESSDRYSQGFCERDSDSAAVKSRSKMYYPPNGEPPLKVLVTDVTCNFIKVTFVESNTEKGFFRNSLDTN